MELSRFFCYTEDEQGKHEKDPESMEVSSQERLVLVLLRTTDAGSDRLGLTRSRADRPSGSHQSTDFSQTLMFPSLMVIKQAPRVQT